MQYICTRCLRSLFPDRLPLRLLSERRIALSAAYATTSTKPCNAPENKLINDGHESHNAEDDTSEPLRTRSWRTLLKKKSLGQDSSVLVLRDSEAKKGQRRASAQQDSVTWAEDETISNAIKILSSINEQNATPSEAEVFNHISALRPLVNHQLRGNASMSLESFNQWVAKLSDSFTRKQLGDFLQRYLGTDKKDRHTTDTEHSTMDSVDQSSIGHRDCYQHVRLSEWRPQTSYDQLEQPSGTAQGRNRIAANILRLAWGFEVKEHVFDKGSMDMIIETHNMELLLLGGSKSVLSDLSRKQGIKIEVHGYEKITIKDSKQRCLGVAGEVDKLLQQQYTSEFATQPLFSKLPQQILQDVAERSRCVISRAGSKTVIRGWSEHSVQRCLRLLVSRDPRKTMGVEICKVNGDSERFGVISAGTLIKDDLPYKLREQNLGRFVLPEALENTHKTPFASNKIEYLDQQTVGNIPTHLLLEPLLNAPTATKGKLSVDFGHILHPIENDKTLRSSTSGSLLLKSTHHFIPSVVGAQSLLSSVLNMSSERREFLRIRLRPSPWAQSAIKIKGDLPDLEMIVSLSSDSSPQMDSLLVRAILRRQAVGIMIPDSRVDMRLVRQDAYFLRRPERQPSVENFIREMQDSAAGFGKTMPPSFLNIGLPRTILQSELVKGEIKKKDQADDFEFSYFTTGLETEENVKFSHDGYELTYFRTDGGEISGNYEGMSLSTPLSNFLRSSAEREPQGADEGFGRFILTAAGVLKTMNSGSGADDSRIGELSNNRMKS